MSHRVNTALLQYFPLQDLFDEIQRRFEVLEERAKGSRPLQLPASPEYADGQPHAPGPDAPVVTPIGPAWQSRMVTDELLARTPEEAGDNPAFIVRGVDRMEAAEADIREMMSILKDPLASDGEKATAQRAIDLRWSSSQSMSLAAVIAANKANAEDAFVQPILPPDVSKMVKPGYTTGVECLDQEKILVMVEDLTTKDFFDDLLASAITACSHPAVKDQEKVVGFSQEEGEGGRREIRLKVTPQFIWRLLQTLEDSYPSWAARSKAIKFLASKLLALGFPDSMVPQDVGIASPEAYRKSVSDFLERQIKVTNNRVLIRGLVRQQRAMNPFMVEQEVPDSFFQDGPGGDGGRANIRESWGEEVRSLPGSYRPSASPVAAQTMRLADEIAELG